MGSSSRQKGLNTYILIHCVPILLGVEFDVKQNNFDHQSPQVLKIS